MAKADNRIGGSIWRTALVLLLLLGLGGCGKKEPFDPTLFNPGFKGITFTDSRGNINGPVDPNDWHWDSNWPYEGLIGPSPSPPEYSSSDTFEIVPVPAVFSIHAAYPNPTTDTVTIAYGLPISSWVFMAIIDDKLNTVTILLDGARPAGFHRVKWDLRGYWGDRIYGGVYRCIFAVEAEHKGRKYSLRSHGDIWVK